MTKSKKKIKDETSQFFKEYCAFISLHGYNYMFLNENKVSRAIWSLVILFFSAVAIQFLIINTNQYLNSRLTTTIESSSAPLEV